MNIRKNAVIFILTALFSFYALSNDTWLKKSEIPLGEGLIKLNENEIIFSGWKADDSGNYDLVLTKSNDLGEIEWSKSYGDVGQEWVSRLLAGQSGEIFLLGSTTSFGSGDRDLWVLKLDEEGSIIWQKRYATEKDECPSINLLLSDGNLLSVDTNISSLETIAIKIDTRSGEIIWQKKYYPTSSPVMSLTEDPKGNLYFVFIENDHTSVILKTSDKGDILWQKKLTYAKELWLGDIKAVSGNIFLTARIWDDNARMAIMEMDEEGNILSEKAFTPPFPSCGFPRITFLSSGGILISNQVGLTKDGNVWNSWLLQLDSNWNIVWERQYNIENNGNFYEIKELNENSYIGIGSTYVNYYATNGLLCRLNKEGSLSFDCPLEKEISSTVFESFKPKVEVIGNCSETDYDLVAFDTYIQPKDCNISLFDLCSPTCPTIEISPSSLPSGRSGESYNATLTASGGSAPYKFSISSGKLPSGISLSEDGVLSGTPSEGGDFSFTVTATDSSYCSGSKNYTLHIEVVPPTISSVQKLSNPFRLKISGSNFHSDLKVYIGGDSNAWEYVKYKSSSEIVLKGGNALKSKFPKGVPVEIKIVNGDGGSAALTYKR